MLEKPCPVLDEIGAADGSWAFAPAAEKGRTATSFLIVDRTPGAVVVANNPINFTDPTGELIWLQQLAQRLAATPAGQWAARQATAASQAVQRYGQQAWQAARNYLQRGQVPCPPPTTQTVAEQQALALMNLAAQGRANVGMEILNQIRNSPGGAAQIARLNQIATQMSNTASQSPGTLTPQQMSNITWLMQNTVH